jgi:hypothetical protein
MDFGSAVRTPRVPATGVQMIVVAFSSTAASVIVTPSSTVRLA